MTDMRRRLIFYLHRKAYQRIPSLQDRVVGSRVARITGTVTSTKDFGAIDAPEGNLVATTVVRKENDAF